MLYRVYTERNIQTQDSMNFTAAHSINVGIGDNLDIWPFWIWIYSKIIWIGKTFGYTIGPLLNTNINITFCDNFSETFSLKIDDQQGFLCIQLNKNIVSNIPDVTLVLCWHWLSFLSVQCPTDPTAVCVKTTIFAKILSFKTLKQNVLKVIQVFKNVLK